MTVLVLESVPVGLRGHLSRWMLEVKAGVFVGKISARVREELWAHVKKSVRSGAAVLVFKSASEQGFDFDLLGTPSRGIVDFDGLRLVKTA